MSLHPLAARRARAYGLDALGYLGIAASMVPIGVALHYLAPPTPLQVIAISAIPPVAATLWAARAESSVSGSTWGKKKLGLSVRRGDSSPSFGRAVVRNVVKIAIPWQLGHVAAIGAATGGFERQDPLTITATVMAYPLVGVLALTTVLGSGRGLHDRIAGTCVESRTPGGT